MRIPFSAGINVPFELNQTIVPLRAICCYRTYDNSADHVGSLSLLEGNYAFNKYAQLFQDCKIDSMSATVQCVRYPEEENNYWSLTFVSCIDRHYARDASAVAENRTGPYVNGVLLSTTRKDTVASYESNRSHTRYCRALTYPERSNFVHLEPSNTVIGRMQMFGEQTDSFMPAMKLIIMRNRGGGSIAPPATSYGIEIKGSVYVTFRRPRYYDPSEQIVPY